VGRGVELGLLAGRLGEEELPHGTYHGRCRNQDSTSTRSSRRIHSNPRHPGAQITPNLQETPRIKTPAPAAWRGPAARFGAQEGKNSGGSGAPR
jgi:hypothetical protein